MELKYCLTCEEVVAVESPIEGHTVIEFVPDEGQQEVLWCEGPFTNAPCPDVDPNWDLYLEEPAQEELAIMNANA